MIKYICDVISKQMLENDLIKVSDNHDVWIINHNKYSCFCGETFNGEEVREIATLIHKNNHLAALSVNKILDEDEVIECLTLIESLQDVIDYVIYSDMAVYDFVSSLNKEIKLIYDSKTYVASSQENIWWRRRNVIPLLANELSQNEIEAIATDGNVAFEVFGYHQIMYSKRKLLSLYKQFLQEENQSDRHINQNTKLFLKEEFRDEFYPIYEQEQGTFIFTPYLYNALDLLNTIDEKIDYLKINGDFLNENLFLDVYHIFDNVRNGTIKVEEANAMFNKMQLNTSRGFLDQKSILLKDN